MQFRKDNKISYGQDHGFYKGIPHGIHFEVRKLNNKIYKIKAKGYGSKDDYGNGPLYVFIFKLTKKQIIRFEKNSKGTENYEILG